MFKIVNNNEYYLSVIHKSFPFWGFNKSTDKAIIYHSRKEAEKVLKKINPQNCDNDSRLAWVRTFN
ncbi:MAG: hypothetical protein COA97_03445 [Flavobacteriales bacterium]|nr:MAG: hypothetical protein COA97_03445 [Flavobacteriales bacterium]